MNARAFQLLLWSTVIAAVAAILAVALDRSTTPARVAGNAEVAPFASHTADVALIGIETPNYKLTLGRRGETWLAGDRGDYPARAGSVANLMTSLAAMKLIEPKTRNPDLFAQLGVENRAPGAASTLYNFQYAGGANAGGIIIGKRSSSASFDQRGATFVRRAGENQAWLASGEPNAPQDFSDWLAPLPSVPGPEVRRIAISEGDKVIFAAAREPEGRYTRADASEPGANDTNVKRIAQAIVSSNFDDVRPVAGLPDPYRRIHIELDAGALDILLVGVEGKTWTRFEGEAAGPSGDLIKAAKGFAFLLPGYRLSGLTQSVADLTAAEQPAAPPPGLAMPQGDASDGPASLPPDVLRQLQEQLSRQQQQAK